MRSMVALMMSRDEEDIIEDVLRSWRRHDIPVLAIDDFSDRTFEICSPTTTCGRFISARSFPMTRRARSIGSSTRCWR